MRFSGRLPALQLGINGRIGTQILYQPAAVPRRGAITAKGGPRPCPRPVRADMRQMHRHLPRPRRTGVIAFMNTDLRRQHSRGQRHQIRRE